jgi:hypothetical protein
MDSVQESIEHTITEAVTQYFAACRLRIPGFIHDHFKYPGAWQTNRQALGWDILRAPLNLFWAPIYLSLQLLAILLRKLTLIRLGNLLLLIPSGFVTDVQRYLSNQTYRYLLGRETEPDKGDKLFLALRSALINLHGNHDHLSSTSISSIDAIVGDALEQYRITRTASADIGNSLLSTIVGAFAFQKFTPGGIAIGIAIAGWLAHQLAVDNFIFGKWIGSWYYAVFPPSPSFWLNLGSIAFVLTCLAVFASFSGLITDPIQCWTGLHRRRLSKMINKLESDFLEKKTGGFRPKDQFVARVLEVLDAAKAPLF